MSKISKEQMQRTEAWHKKAFALLQGQKIETILWKQWDEDSTTGLVLVLDSGTALFISEDDEGNGPGAIHWSTGRAESVSVEIGGNKTVMVEPHGVLPVGVMETAQWREEEINQEVEANKQMIADKVDEINNLANQVEGVTNG